MFYVLSSLRCVVYCRQGAGSVWHGTERLYVNCGHSGREERAGEGQVNGWGRVCTGRC